MIALTLNPLIKLATSIGIFLILNLLMAEPVYAEEPNPENNNNTKSFYERNEEIIINLTCATILLIIGILLHIYGSDDVVAQNAPTPAMQRLALTPDNVRILFNEYAQAMPTPMHISSADIPERSIAWVTNSPQLRLWLDAGKKEEFCRILNTSIDLSNRDTARIAQNLLTGIRINMTDLDQYVTPTQRSVAYWVSYYTNAV